MNVEICPLDTKHLSDICRIEKVAHTHPWSDSLLVNVDSRGACHRVLLKQGRVIGYYYAQHVVGEVTLLNIAIDPEYQGKGYGKVLLAVFLEMCVDLKAESAWLEVRQSNVTACSIYESAGFNEVDRRRNYYPTSTGKEDAIIMSQFFF
ncbi:ribosomal protein S18-alanine N-acetyltransferase [Vibrio ostreicida]|uniref:[Ribosomal protein bS18]-alanine N-acetyltransferase n=1 Tax=Vibrio ostreicida TaxID=526588 RepID=A0ABT8BR17_9VIBR|nr:ribosomal protein S18-alanine N-acetyltransferase [Vibrio ostreicida]MDN3609114.1 ribosomal protein S18-alanine N-acetyltransferase [Vibrio ostreicida]NPD08007.1 ribosomal protein S18-alanine N-acetyltransferase [Vibrio ostreicida]